MIRIVLFFLFSSMFLFSGIVPIDIKPASVGNHFMRIKILDQRWLNINEIDGVKFSEISDLAYDRWNHLLYMVGDKGTLFSFSAKFTKEKMNLQPQRAAYLKNSKGKRFKKRKRDSEGLCLDGKRDLLISFEGDVKVARFHKNGRQFGQIIHKLSLPEELTKITHYRTKNKALESLAWHPKFGLLTAAEWPLRKYEKKEHMIYSLLGKKWTFRAEKEANSSLVAIETMDDGNLLVLERSYSGLLNPFVITLKKVYLKECIGRCRSEVLAKFNTHKGWSIDNFEGLTKVGKNQYLMISDNGDNFFEKTLLIYFEVTDP